MLEREDIMGRRRTKTRGAKTGGMAKKIQV
jgi:hypothetical protein